MTGQDYNENLKKELIAWVKSVIGPIAAPDVIQWAPSLPTTRSGKIMRRILRKVACKEEESIGDTSTLNDPSVVNELVGQGPVPNEEAICQEVVVGLPGSQNALSVDHRPLTRLRMHTAEATNSQGQPFVLTNSRAVCIHRFTSLTQ